jgi:hypothetical protein
LLTNVKKPHCWRLVRLYLGLSNPTAQCGAARK